MGFEYEAGFGSGFDLMFTVVPLIIGVISVAIVITIIIQVTRGIGEWSSNNQSPILTVQAAVTSKRIDVSRHHHSHAGDPHGHTGSHTSTSTSYYVTFQVESGDRMEFHVSGKEYGILAEGDSGKLTFQGTRYKGFEHM